MPSNQFQVALEMSKLIFKIRLRQLMDRDGILQRELADVVHVSPVLISKYVSGKTFPRYNKLLMIATYFQIPLDVLVGQDELSQLYLRAPTNNSNELKFIKSNLLTQFVEKYNIDPILAINHCKNEFY